MISSTTQSAREMAALADRVEQHVKLLQRFDTDMNMKTWNILSNDLLDAAKALRTVAAATVSRDREARPVAWSYKCRDGSEVLMLKRLTDAQKATGYYTGDNGEDEVDGDEPIVGPFHWAEETPLFATPAAGYEAGEMQRWQFQGASIVPDVKKGRYEDFVVLIENEKGKRFTYAAYYLNAYPLEYEDCKCTDDNEHDDGCPTTGWFYDNSNFEYENCFYPLTGKLIGWAWLPTAEEATAALAALPVQGTQSSDSVAQRIEHPDPDDGTEDVGLTPIAVAPSEAIPVGTSGYSEFTPITARASTSPLVLGGDDIQTRCEQPELSGHDGSEAKSGNVELASPFGAMSTTFGDIENGRKGFIVRWDLVTSYVKFANVPSAVSVPRAWLRPDVPASPTDGDVA